MVHACMHAWTGRALHMRRRWCGKQVKRQGEERKEGKEACAPLHAGVLALHARPLHAWSACARSIMESMHVLVVQDGWSLLHAAAAGGHTALLKQMLAMGADAKLADAVRPLVVLVLCRTAPRRAAPHWVPDRMQPQMHACAQAPAVEQASRSM